MKRGSSSAICTARPESPESLSIFCLIMSWMAAASPPGVVEGHSQRVPAKPLATPGPIAIMGKRQT